MVIFRMKEKYCFRCFFFYFCSMFSFKFLFPWRIPFLHFLGGPCIIDSFRKLEVTTSGSKDHVLPWSGCFRFEGACTFSNWLYPARRTIENYRCFGVFLVTNWLHVRNSEICLLFSNISWRFHIFYWILHFFNVIRYM